MGVGSCLSMSQESMQGHRAFKWTCTIAYLDQCTWAGIPCQIDTCTLDPRQSYTLCAVEKMVIDFLDAVGKGALADEWPQIFSWITVHDTSPSYHGRHYHRNQAMTAVLYLDVNEKSVRCPCSSENAAKSCCSLRQVHPSWHTCPLAVCIGCWLLLAAELQTDYSPPFPSCLWCGYS
jgi:hypothetical protein